MSKIDLNEFITNPTILSLDILKKYLLNKSIEYERKFSARGFFKRLFNNVKINYLYQTEYLEGYKFVKDFNYNDQDFYGLSDLLRMLGDVFEKIILNNFLLTYAMVIEKEPGKPVATKSDLLQEMLLKFYSDKINRAEFNNIFGHYSNNEYELNAPRYEELSFEEMKQIAKFSARYKKQPKLDLVQYIENKPKKIFYIYAALREEYKYIALLYIREIRKILLKIQKNKNIGDIFNYSLQEVLKIK